MPYPVAAVRGKNYGGGLSAYETKVNSYSPIAYWPLKESGGSVAYDISGNSRNGSYTGVTLGQTGIGDGNTAPLFDGTNDYVNIYSAGFAGAFSGAAGTVSYWAKVYDVGTWDNATISHHFTIYSDADNMVRCYKNNVANQVRWYYYANTASENYIGTPGPSTAWIHYAISWSKAANDITYYIAGTEDSDDAGLDTWDGVGLDSDRTLIGAYDSSPLTNPFYGYIAHFAVFNSQLTPANVAILAAV